MANESRIDQLYSPLASWETRILALHAGSFEEDLEADLLVAVITDYEGLGLKSEDRNVPYEALSYTWGQQIFSKTILCNGVAVGITENLDEALRHLRRIDEKIYLWVDALCINQDDPEEKARQIRNLFSIFRKARQVIAWLGKRGDFTDYAITQFKSTKKKLLSEELNRVVKSKGFVDGRVNFENVPAQRLLAGLLDLSNRPWVRRACIVQEVFAATTVSVRCGSMELDWQEFKYVGEVLRGAMQWTPKTVDRWNFNDLDTLTTSYTLTTACSIYRHFVRRMICAVYSIRFLDRPRMTERELKFLTIRYGSTLSEGGLVAVEFAMILHDSAHLRATDLRDKVYALVALNSVPSSYGTQRSVDSTGIRIDYTLTTAQVYQDVTKYMINACRNLYILYARTSCILRREKDGIADLPSWAIDWRDVRGENIADVLLRYPDVDWMTWIG